MDSDALMHLAGPLPRNCRNRFIEKIPGFTEGEAVERASSMKLFDPSKTGCKEKLIQVIDNIRTTFCSDIKHLYLDPGGGTCLERDISKGIAKDYCSVGNRITGVDSGTACTIEYIGNSEYGRLAEKYCKTSAGRSNPWCSCYNVMNGVCNTNSAAAGCDKKRQTFDKLVEATPEDFKTSWSQMEPCFGGVCQGSVFQPAGYNSNCNRPVQVCVQDFDIQGIADSPINATCNLNSDSGSSAGGGDGGSGGGGSGSVQQFIPTSIEDLKTNKNAQFGIGGISFCCVCLLVIIILITLGGRGESGRFRR